MSQYPNPMPNVGPPGMQGPNLNPPPQPPNNSGGPGCLFGLMVLIIGIAVIIGGLTMFYNQLNECPDFDYYGINHRVTKFAALGAGIVGIVGLVKLVLQAARKV